jgi:hypothetical protein
MLDSQCVSSKRRWRRILHLVWKPERCQAIMWQMF